MGTERRKDCLLCAAQGGSGSSKQENTKVVVLKSVEPMKRDMLVEDLLELAEVIEFHGGVLIP